MIIKTFESYWENKESISVDDALNSISSNSNWKLVEDPEKEYGINIEMDYLYKHTIKFCDILFVIRSIKNLVGYQSRYTILWIYDSRDKSIVYLDDPCNKYSYRNLYAPTISSWCIKVGEDFLEYLEWESKMPTEEEIHECFQDLIDDGKSFEVYYGRGRDPKSLWDLDDYFVKSNYRDEKKILIRMRSIDPSYVDSITKSCELLSNLYGISFKVLSFEDQFKDFGIVCSIT